MPVQRSSRFGLRERFCARGVDLVGVGGEFYWMRKKRKGWRTGREEEDAHVEVTRNGLGTGDFISGPVI